MESKKEKKIESIKNWMIIFLIFIMIILCDTTMKMNENNKKLTEQVESLVEIDKEQTEQIKELWENIDALSEDYHTLWIQLYGEDSWYNKGGN